MEKNKKRLTIVGNGFDLAHKLKTSYGDFLFWYFKQAVEIYISKHSYEDYLIELDGDWSASPRLHDPSELNTISEMLNAIKNSNKRIKFKLPFFNALVKNYSRYGWVDIEAYYFNYLKLLFLSTNYGTEGKRIQVESLNSGFDYLIEKLSEYVNIINSSITNQRIEFETSRNNLHSAFEVNDTSELLVLNFNYTDTLIKKSYAYENECLFIHGRVADINNNPIIFGYGDETDPTYQKIEDSGENVYLTHMKSFGYFRTGHYQKLLTFIDSGVFDVFIVGHSCGLSDRILLNEVFEHKNCDTINVFYHKKEDGTDNFKEITQEISRHFKPVNKNMMRRKVQPKDKHNFIPQIKN